MIGKRGGFVVVALLGVVLVVGSVQTSEPSPEFTHCVDDYADSQPAEVFEFHNLSNDAQSVFLQTLNTTDDCVILSDQSRVPPEFTYSEDNAGPEGGVYHIVYQSDTYSLTTGRSSSARLDGVRHDVMAIGALLIALAGAGFIKSMPEQE
jgi:hypothetical protein